MSPHSPAPSPQHSYNNAGAANMCGPKASSVLAWRVVDEWEAESHKPKFSSSLWHSLAVWSWIKYLTTLVFLHSFVKWGRYTHILYDFFQLDPLLSCNKTVYPGHSRVTAGHPCRKNLLLWPWPWSWPRDLLRHLKVAEVACVPPGHRL